MVELITVDGLRGKVTVGFQDTPKGVVARVSESYDLKGVSLDLVVEAVSRTPDLYSLDLSSTKLPDAFLKQLWARRVTVSYLRAVNCPGLSADGLLSFVAQSKDVKTLVVNKARKDLDIFQFALEGEKTDLTLV